MASNDTVIDSIDTDTTVSYKLAEGANKETTLLILSPETTIPSTDTISVVNNSDTLTPLEKTLGVTLIVSYIVFILIIIFILLWFKSTYFKRALHRKKQSFLDTEGNDLEPEAEGSKIKPKTYAYINMSELQTNFAKRTMRLKNKSPFEESNVDDSKKDKENKCENTDTSNGKDDKDIASTSTEVVINNANVENDIDKITNTDNKKEVAKTLLATSKLENNLIELTAEIVINSTKSENIKPIDEETKENSNQDNKNSNVESNQEVEIKKENDVSSNQDNKVLNIVSKAEITLQKIDLENGNLIAVSTQKDLETLNISTEENDSVKNSENMKKDEEIIVKKEIPSISVTVATLEFHPNSLKDNNEGNVEENGKKSEENQDKNDKKDTKSKEMSPILVENLF